MWFKNIQFYRLTKDFKYSSVELQQALEKHSFIPCKSHQASRYGWIAPCLQQKEILAPTIQDWTMVSLQQEQKILPASVINELVAQKVAQIEEQQNRTVYKKERSRIKEESTLDLLPRAFSRYRTIDAIIAPEQKWIAINASSRTHSEALLNHLRTTLGSLPLILPKVNQSPSAVLTSWLTQPQQLPTEFEILDECELQHGQQEGGIIRIKGQPLTDDECIAHLQSGKQIVKLALEWNKQLNFILHQDLSLKRLKLNDQYQEQFNDKEIQDEIASFNSDLLQMGHSFGRLITALIAAFGGEAKD